MSVAQHLAALRTAAVVVREFTILGGIAGVAVGSMGAAGYMAERNAESKEDAAEPLLGGMVHVSVLHHATVVAHGFMHTGTTVDTFLRQNLDWLRKQYGYVAQSPALFFAR